MMNKQIEEIIDAIEFQLIVANATKTPSIALPAKYGMFLLDLLRKQGEGEWIPSPDGIKPIRCSKCHMPAPFMSCDDDFGGFGFYRYPWKFCPNCGAKMKGGE